MSNSLNLTPSDVQFVANRDFGLSISDEVMPRVLELIDVDAIVVATKHCFNETTKKDYAHREIHKQLHALGIAKLITRKPISINDLKDAHIDEADIIGARNVKRAQTVVIQ